MDDVEKGLALLDELEAADPSEPGYRIDRAATIESRGRLRFGRPGLGREAEADFREAVQLYDELAARFPAAPEYPARAALNRSNVACCMVIDGRPDEAESVFRQALGFWERMAAGDASTGKYRSKIALTLGNLSEVLEKTNRKPEAEQALRRAADLRSVLTQEWPTDPWQVIQLGNLLADLARLAADRGDMAAVRRLEEQAAFQHARAWQRLRPGMLTTSSR